MNYIDLINGFWRKDKEYNFHDREVALYFYLLDVSNSIGWKNPFGLSNSMTIAKFGWGKNSFDTAKNRLKVAGLIDFRPGDGRGNVYQYELKVLEKVGKIAPLSVILSEHLSDTLSDEKPETSINVNGKQKLKTTMGANAPRDKVFVPPTFEEAKEFFLARRGDQSRPDAWPEDRCYNEAANFFDFYDANGWVQGKGSKKIKKWQAAACKWIRNSMQGTFTTPSKPQPADQPPAPAPPAPKPQLTKHQVDLNYKYERFVEDENAVTIQGLEVYDYELLKQHGKVILNKGDLMTIEKDAAEYDPTADATKLLRLKKLFAVLAVFRRHKAEQKEVIYVPA